MKKTKIILIIISIVLIAISFLYSGYSFFHRNDVQQAYKVSKVYKDKFDRSVRTIDQITIDLDYSRAAEATAKYDRNEFQKELVWLYGEYDALGFKYKNLKAVTIVNTRTTGEFDVNLKDSTIYTYKDSLIVDSTDVKSGYFSDGYLSQIISMPYPYYEANCQYSILDTIMVFDTWIRKPNKKGKQAFILWRWMKPWQVRLDVRSQNPRTEIVNTKKVIINNKRRK